MKSLRFLSKSTQQTIHLGSKIAQYLMKGDIICLLGDLGSGKTTLTKGIAKGLKVNQKDVHSPTFVLMNEYKGRLPIFHFDFYRIHTLKEIAALGIEEFFFGEGISIIEWADRLHGLTPQDYLVIKMLFKREEQRLIQISAKGKRSKELLSNMAL